MRVMGWPKMGPGGLLLFLAPTLLTVLHQSSVSSMSVSKRVNTYSGFVFSCDGSSADDGQAPTDACRAAGCQCIIPMGPPLCRFRGRSNQTAEQQQCAQDCRCTDTLFSRLDTVAVEADPDWLEVVYGKDDDEDEEHRQASCSWPSSSGGSRTSSQCVEDLPAANPPPVNEDLHAPVNPLPAQDSDHPARPHRCPLGRQGHCVSADNCTRLTGVFSSCHVCRLPTERLDGVMDPLDAMTNRRSRRGRCAFLPGPAESSPKRDTTVADEAREDDRLECACNMTYISRQCCFQPSGIVHEPAYLKLGEIRLKGDDEWWEVESMPETLARHLST